ncbi:hypothetical protein TNIN_194701 [Trichonephila inaurata madagascariensis]|uniref:Uncharacterized protein n=1 Tax=Trichonephila inaurata madagascariensis TaxID=2747483 RepID=A0A8X6Y147_9ARAC|nr:hypothetical protein TNIN_194701 [Trichonephila inaurata madagascariensis]
MLSCDNPFNAELCSHSNIAPAVYRGSDVLSSYIRTHSSSETDRSGENAPFVVKEVTEVYTVRNDLNIEDDFFEFFVTPEAPFSPIKKENLMRTDAVI